MFQLASDGARADPRTQGKGETGPHSAFNGLPDIPISNFTLRFKAGGLAGVQGCG
jgi:hypothetical protein